jgi:hypothetical protein
MICGKKRRGLKHDAPLRRINNITRIMQPMSVPDDSRCRPISAIAVGGATGVVEWTFRNRHAVISIAPSYTAAIVRS